MSPTDTGFPSIADNLDSNPSLTFEDLDLDGACQTLRIWTVTDHAGNQASVRQYITSVSIRPIQVSDK